ncbi:MAG: glycosyltransferase [Lachnospiraceae bacterium]|nr:glycosyltransferase [Lachnospiraceae bacterium]
MSKQPKIAMLIGALSKGGSERVLVNLSEYLIGQGWQVTMVTQYQKEEEYPLNPKVKRLIADIAEEEVSSNRILNFKRRFCKFRNIWKQEKPDVILSFIGKNNMMALLTSRFLRIPVVVSVRGEPTMEYYSKWMRILAKQLFKLADGVILQTKRCMEFFPESVKKKAVILKNPMNPSFFREPYTGLREKEIVAVGRIDENKNHEMLIRAFAQIAEEFPQYHVTIYGEGELKQHLIHLAAELGLSDRIKFPGAVQDVASAIRKAGIFVLTSDTEGVPNTLIEAMLLGLNVISTDCPCGGPADLIEAGVNGLLSPVRDEARLAANLKHAIADLESGGSMGQNALKLREAYAPEKVYKDWESYLYDLALRRK